MKPGDIVQLKSGGPAMTIVAIPYADIIRCAWFNGGDISEYEFHPATLEPSEKKEHWE